MGGGQSGTLTFFSKSVTYWSTLSKFRGGPVKKITLYIIFKEPGLIAATTEGKLDIDGVEGGALQTRESMHEGTYLLKV